MEARTITLVAATVSTITFTSDAQHVEVVNVDGVAAVFFTVDTGVNPVVDGDDCYMVTAVAGASLVVDAPGASAGTSVKLISAGTPKLRVTTQSG